MSNQLSRGSIDVLGVVFLIGIALILGGIWTRWLLEDRLLQTGALFLGVWLFFAARSLVVYAIDKLAA